MLECVIVCQSLLRPAKVAFWGNSQCEKPPWQLGNFNSLGNENCKKRFHRAKCVYICAMEKMDEKLVKLLRDAMDVFMRYGIRSVTMDDLARHLSISKKTLYKYVTDKNDLVAKGFQLHQEMECRTMEDMVKRGLNAIDENFEISQVVIAQVKDIHPSIMYDIEKYYPEAMKQFHDYKMDVVMGWVKDNLRRGMEEGYYRDDLNIDVIAAAYVRRMDDFFHRDLYPPNLSFPEIYMELFRYHIRGIASEKGVQYLKQKVAKENSK